VLRDMGRKTEAAPPFPSLTSELGGHLLAASLYRHENRPREVKVNIY